MKTKTEIWLIAYILIIVNALLVTYNIGESKRSYKLPQNYFTLPMNGNKRFKAIVTAFNTVLEQTDGNPCMAKSGYICGRNDVVACPRNIPQGMKVKIKDKLYTCLDFTSYKHNGRFDISFDKDIESAKRFGKQRLEVEIIN